MSALYPELYLKVAALIFVAGLLNIYLQWRDQHREISRDMNDDVPSIVAVVVMSAVTFAVIALAWPVAVPIWLVMSKKRRNR